ncbi:MAG: NAD(P)/FAD-dependent oxidoreductase, partial [Actinomycetota bacterium]
MSEHEHTPMTRRCDVAIVGGSASGLAAALQIQRQRRSVIVVDSGEPRNAPALHMHGYLGYDGAPPIDLVTAGRAEFRRYGGEILHGHVDTVDHGPGGFTLDLGHVLIRARRVVAATGAADELPPVDGLAERWGTTVIHCPFCHGYEFRGQRLVQLVTHQAGLHPARLFAHLTDQLTLVVPSGLDVDADELSALARAGAVVVQGEVRRVDDADA